MAKIRIFAAFLAIVVVSMVGALKLKAQNPKSYYEEVPRLFYGGLILGGNFAQVDGDNFAGYHKVGLNAGGIVYAHVAPKVAASLEILFSQKGSHSNKFQMSNSKQFGIDKYNINLNYAEIPIMINYFDARKSHFGAGLAYSRLISSSESISTNPQVDWSDSLGKFPFKKSDVSLVAGANLHLAGGFFLNLRYQYSLMAIRDNFYPDFGRAAQYNNVWTVRLMYLFD